MPGRTSAWLFEQVHSHFVYLRNSNSKIFLPNQFAAPAATIQTLVNGAVCTRLSSRKRWVQAYTNDTELCAVRNLAVNPSLITSKTLATVNHNYLGPLCQLLISVEAGTYQRNVIIHTFAISSKRGRQYCFHRLPHQPYRRTSQHLPDFTSHLTSILLARHVCLHETNVYPVSRLRVI